MLTLADFISLKSKPTSSLQENPIRAVREGCACGKGVFEFTAEAKKVVSLIAKDLMMERTNRGIGRSALPKMSTKYHYEHFRQKRSRDPASINWTRLQNI